MNIYTRAEITYSSRRPSLSIFENLSMNTAQTAHEVFTGVERAGLSNAVS